MTFGKVKEALLIHFAPEERSMPDASDFPGRNESCDTAINSALQLICSIHAQWNRRGDHGFMIYAPTTVTATVTNGSREIDFGDDWQAWFEGCACRIVNAQWDNRIQSRDQDGETLLVNPHDGASGTIAVTIYCDSITLPTEIAELLTPVMLKGHFRLNPAPSASALAYSFDRYEDYNLNDQTVVAPRPPEVSQSASKPRRYCVDTVLQTPYGAPSNRLRFFPAANEQFILEARVRYAIPVYAGVTDIGLDLPIPNNYCESILIPIAEQYLTKSPFFRNDAARATIASSYDQALKILTGLSPQKNPGKRLRSIY